MLFQDQAYSTKSLGGFEPQKPLTELCLWLRTARWSPSPCPRRGLAARCWPGPTLTTGAADILISEPSPHRQADTAPR